MVYKIENENSKYEKTTVKIYKVNQKNTVFEEYDNKNIVIGSHGTALSMIINYYDKSFNYKSFKKIKSLMPWIVCFTFDEDKCLSIEQYNVFDNKH